MTSLFVGSNFFGAGNFGDDLSLTGFLSFAARYGDVEITICTPHDIESQQRRFPRIQWLRDSESAREGALRSADVWLGLGGTPFQLDSGPWLLEHNERERRRRVALGKPMYFLGVGCESPEAAADPRSQALLAAAEHVWTRDESSAAQLQPFIAPSRLTAAADLAHLAFPSTASQQSYEPGVLGLLLASERPEQFDVVELERFLERRPPHSTRWLVQEVRPLPHLERWILGELSSQARSVLSVAEIDYTTCSMQAYLRAFGRPGTTVTSRYHGALVAAWHRSKVLVVSRSAKLRGIAEQLDLPQIAYVRSHSELEEALQTAAIVPRERLELVREKAREMCDTFFAEIFGLAARAEASA